MCEHDIDVKHHADDLYAEEQAIVARTRELVGHLVDSDIGVIHAMAISISKSPCDVARVVDTVSGGGPFNYDLLPQDNRKYDLALEDFARGGSYSRAKPTALGGKLIPPSGRKHVFKQVGLENEKDIS